MPPPEASQPTGSSLPRLGRGKGRDLNGTRWLGRRVMRGRGGGRLHLPCPRFFWCGAGQSSRAMACCPTYFVLDTCFAVRLAPSSVIPEGFQREGGKTSQSGVLSGSGVRSQRFSYSLSRMRRAQIFSSNSSAEIMLPWAAWTSSQAYPNAYPVLTDRGLPIHASLQLEGFANAGHRGASQTQR